MLYCHVKKGDHCQSWLPCKHALKINLLEKKEKKEEFIVIVNLRVELIFAVN